MTVAVKPLGRATPTPLTPLFGYNPKLSSAPAEAGGTYGKSELDKSGSHLLGSRKARSRTVALRRIDGATLTHLTLVQE